MALTGTQVVAKARYLLNDTSGVRWTDAEMLEWVNDGRREMATLKPSVFGEGTEVTHALTAGCKQRVATVGAYQIDSVNYNVSTGRSIRITTRDQLDAFKSTWRSDTGTEVQNWFSDETDPLSFWVYPAASGKSIKIHIHISPIDLTSLSDMALPFDIYEPALVNYLCFRAMSKEDEASAAEKAAAFYQLFTAALK